jgi:hypothetical protein
MMMPLWTREHSLMPQMMMLVAQILWRLHHPFLSHLFSFGVPLGVDTSTIGE